MKNNTRAREWLAGPINKAIEMKTDRELTKLMEAFTPGSAFILELEQTGAEGITCRTSILNKSVLEIIKQPAKRTTRSLKGDHS